MKIHIAKNSDDIKKCYPCFQQLRPKISETTFVSKINKLIKTGHFLIFLLDKKIVMTVVLFHITENIGRGKYLYIDEFVTDKSNRSKGNGSKIFKWLIPFAKKKDCVSIRTDSGINRHHAHRFYITQGMQVVSKHFNYDL